MSSVGQGLGGIVGGVIGFMVGGPSGALYGAQVGMMVGGLLDPPKVEGPRLEDLSQQTSTYGVFIPRAYGTVALHGNVFWIQGDSLIERGVESGGKGGPEVTNYEYYASFAISLCEGPIDGVRRIWIGGQLWYDAGSDDLGTIISSNESAAKFTLYKGTETQEADPLIQADRGVTNVPAYRGLAYIVFNELPLKDVGNTIAGAQVKVEVVNSATFAEPRLIDSIDIAGYPVKYYPRPAAPNGQGVLSVFAYDPWNPADKVAIDISYSGVLLNVSTNFPARLLEVQTSSSGLMTTAIGYLDGDKVWWPEYSGDYAIQNGTRKILPWGTLANKDTADVDGTRGDIADYLTGEAGRFIIGVAFSNSEAKILITTGAVSRKTSASADRYFILDSDLNITASGAIANTTAGIWNLGNATSEAPNGGSALDDVSNVGWTTYVPASGFIGTRYYYIDSAGVMQISAEILSSMAGSDYLAAVFADGIFYVVARNSTIGRVYRYTAFPTITGATALLGDIVYGECLKSKLLAASDIDVRELTDAVRGYRISSFGPIRGGIDPLRKAWPFDVVQHGYQIKFKTRGGASVATITEAELDAREAGASTGVQVTNIREMDTILPDQLTTKYLDAAREYDINVAEQTR